MRTLHRYLLRETLATLFMTVAVFTFLLLLGNALKEVLSLLINRQASLGALGLAFLFLIPYVLVFALPMGLLTAALLVFGRVSADQELTAMRASGVSLVALITPVLLLSVALSGVSALINMEVAPRCRVAYKQLLMEMGVARAGQALPEKVFIKDFPGRIVYIGNVDGTRLRDILVYDLDQEGNLRAYLRAAEGQIKVNEATRSITLRVTNTWYVEIVEGAKGFESRPAQFGEAELVYTNELDAAEERVQLSDMSIRQLFREMKDLESRVVPPVVDPSLPDVSLNETIQVMEKQRRELTLPVKMQIHRQIAFSFACVAFTLVGIPLGIRAHRRETTFGIAVALLLVLLYYSFFIIGHAVEAHAEFYPYLILWVPNFLFEVIGIVLLIRANRGL